MYEHSQPAGLIVLVPVIAGIIVTAYLGFLLSNIASLSTCGILVVVLFLFHKLTVSIDGMFIHVRFGPGIVGMKFRLDHIESCEVVRNPWYAGWGLRVLPRGYLLNIAGLDAVELRMKTGQTHRIGTDEPRVLCQAIETMIGSR